MSLLTFGVLKLTVVMPITCMSLLVKTINIFCQNNALCQLENCVDLLRQITLTSSGFNLQKLTLACVSPESKVHLLAVYRPNAKNLEDRVNAGKRRGT